MDFVYLPYKFAFHYTMKSLAAVVSLLIAFSLQTLAQPGNGKKGTIKVRKGNNGLEVNENMDENMITNLSIWDGPVHNNITFNFRYFKYLAIGPSYQRVFKLSDNTAILTGVGANFLLEDSAYSLTVPLEFHFNNKPPIIRNFSYGIDFSRFEKFKRVNYTLSPKIGFNIMGSPLSVWYGRNFNLTPTTEIQTINRSHITLRYNLYF